jgi:hypothetical protein
MAKAPLARKRLTPNWPALARRGARIDGMTQAERPLRIEKKELEVSMYKHNLVVRVPPHNGEMSVL